MDHKATCIEQDYSLPGHTYWIQFPVCQTTFKSRMEVLSTGSVKFLIFSVAQHFDGVEIRAQVVSCREVTMFVKNKKSAVSVKLALSTWK